MSKERKITFLGRAGILVNYMGVEYYVDSEMLDGTQYDLVVYTDTLTRRDNADIVVDPLKGLIIDYLLHVLKDEKKLRIDLFQGGSF